MCSYKGKKKEKEKSKGIISIFLIFLILVITMAFLFGIGIPMAIDVNTEAYMAGETMLSNLNVSAIQDATVKESLNNSIQQAKDSTVENVSVMSTFYQYSWLIAILVITFALYMLTRSNVEMQLV